MPKPNYYCYLYYADGLKKTLNLSQQELDDTFDVWKSEMDSDADNELLFLKIRKMVKTNA